MAPCLGHDLMDTVTPQWHIFTTERLNTFGRGGQCPFFTYRAGESIQLQYCTKHAYTMCRQGITQGT